MRVSASFGNNWRFSAPAAPLVVGLTAVVAVIVASPVTVEAEMTLAAYLGVFHAVDAVLLGAGAVVGYVTV